MVVTIHTLEISSTFLLFFLSDACSANNAHCADDLVAEFEQKRENYYGSPSKEECLIDVEITSELRKQQV